MRSFALIADDIASQLWLWRDHSLQFLSKGPLVHGKSSMEFRPSGKWTGALSVGRIIKRHLSAAVRFDPQFLFLRWFSQTALFKALGWHLLQAAECGYPVIAVQNTQAIGKSHGNRALFKPAILQDVIRGLFETRPGLFIDGPGRFLDQHARHNSLRALTEI
jgi:hypothetical protein